MKLEESKMKKNHGFARYLILAAALLGAFLPARAQAAAPGALPYSGIGTDRISANWTPAGASYEARLFTDANFLGTPLISATPNTFVSFTALVPNTTYFGQVRVQAPLSAFTTLGPVVTLAETPLAAAATLIQAAALTANWTTGANPAGTVYETVLSNNPGFTAGTVSTVTTNDNWATFTGLNPGTLYYLRVRSVNNAGAATVFTPLANVTTQASAPAAAGTPDYINYSNYANSALPVVTNGVVSGGIRKFVDSLPGLGYANRNTLNQYIPIATQGTYAGKPVGDDYYEIGLADYTQQMHPDLGLTKLRGYKDLLGVGTDSSAHYLGPLIIATKGRPVRIKFTNQLGTGLAGNLFLPTDTTIMGAGMGPDGMNSYTQNRAVIHLHGGDTPWISDGTPHQWITPVGETSLYKKGASQQNVPDMPNPGDGAATYYFPNQQSSRLMWYHDHTHGITRLNAYAGEAAAYLITDPAEDALIAAALPNLGGVYKYGIPLIIQDKSFVPPAPQLARQDPTWDTAKWGGPGSLWFPHVYVPNQTSNPAVVNPLGRWDYGPWDPVAPVIVANMPVGSNPGTPNPSAVPEAFLDTALVNGAAYPYLAVTKGAYRFRILNGSNDRFMNLQVYYADPANPTEVKMVPAADLRPGGVPDPAKAGPKIIQIGTEAGLLPAPVVMDNQPIALDATGNISAHTLMLAPAERADIVLDFTSVPDGSTLILYNDALAPAPGGDPRYDYYTGNPDQTPSGGAPSTLVGYGPNMRTLMQFKVVGAGAPGTTSFNLGTLTTALATAYAASEVHPVPAGVTAANADESKNFTPAGGTSAATFVVQRKTMDETFDTEYGRLQSGLGVQAAANPTAPNVKFGYSDPVTEFVKDGELQIWRLKNYTGDIHPIHFHLFNVQVLNRVAGDGTVLLPEANELGWKETVRANPGQDIIVALLPKVSPVPFALPDSIRYLDPTLAPDTLFLSHSSTTGAGYMVKNSTFNFGHEYTVHCHILGHEENDFMRPMVLLAAPEAPTFVSAQGGNAAATVSFLIPPTGGSPITGYTVTVSSGGLVRFTATGTSSPIIVTGLTNDENYTFTVKAANAIGAGFASAPSNSARPESIPQAAPYSGIKSLSLTANWGDAGFPDTDFYRAELWTAADFTGTMVSSETYNDFATFTGLAPGTAYYGRAQVLSPTLTPWGSLGSGLTLTLTPLTPALTAVSSTTLNSSWVGAAAAVYEFNLATDSLFTALVSSGTQTGTSRELTGLRGGTSYYFEVRLSTESDDSYPVNTAFKWTLPTVTPLSPNVDASSSTITASWIGTAGSSYWAVLASDIGFNTIISSAAQTGLYKTFRNLQSSTEYYFKVKLSTEADASYVFNKIQETTLASVTPLSPHLTAVSSTSLNATWAGDASAAYSYTLATDSGFTAPVLLSGTQTGTSLVVLNDLRGGTSYYFEVRLSTEADASYAPNKVSGRTLPTVSPLFPVVTAVSSGAITVAWNGRPDVSYVIVLSRDSGFTSIASSTTQLGNSKTFPGLSGSTGYWFEVKISTEADASYTVSFLTAQTLPSVTPLVTAVTLVSSVAINVAWTAVPGATYVAVFSANSSFSPVISSVTLTDAFKWFTGLSPAASYYFEVKLSTEADASYAVNRAPLQTLPAVTGLSPTLAALSPTALSASWNASPGAAYIAVLAEDIGFTAIVSTSTEGGNSKIFSGLTANKDYYFKVKLSSEADVSFVPNTAWAATLPPLTALAPSIAAVSSSTIDISWTGAPGINYTAALARDSGFTSIVSSGSLPGNTRSFNRLASYTSYYFRVKVSSEPDVSYSVNRLSSVTLPPLTVLTPSLSAASRGALTASWTGVAGSTYVVVLMADSGYTQVLSSSTQLGNSKTFTELTDYATYYLQVKLITEWDSSFPYNRVSKRTMAETLSVSKISPDKAIWGPDGLNVTINGTGFTPDSGVKLNRAGQDDIAASGVVVVSPTVIKVTWNKKPASIRAVTSALQQPVSGIWNVVVTGGGQVLTLASAVALIDADPNTAKIYKGLFNPNKGEAAQLTSNLPAAGRVTIRVYDSLGRKVRQIFNGDREAGDHLDAWNGRNEEGSMCASGVYLIRFECPGFSVTKRVVLVK